MTVNKIDHINQLCNKFLFISKNLEKIAIEKEIKNIEQLTNFSEYKKLKIGPLLISVDSNQKNIESLIESTKVNKNSWKFIDANINLCLINIDKTIDMLSNIIELYSANLSYIDQCFSKKLIPLHLQKPVFLTKKIINKIIINYKNMRDVFTSEAKNIVMQQQEAAASRKINKIKILNKDFQDLQTNKINKIYNSIRANFYKFDHIKDTNLNKSEQEIIKLKDKFIQNDLDFETIDNVKFINTKIVKDVEEYHYRGENRKKLVKLIQKFFKTINNDVNSINMNNLKKITKKIFELDIKAAEESKQKKEKRLKTREEKHKKITEKLKEPQLPPLDNILYLSADFMRNIPGTRSSKANQAIREIIAIFRDLKSFKLIKDNLVGTDMYFLYEQIKYRILLDLYKQDPKNQEHINTFSGNEKQINDKIISSIPFKRFILSQTFNLNNYNKEVAIQTFAEPLSNFIRLMFSNPTVSNKIVNSSPVLSNIKVSFLALDAASKLVDTQISPMLKLTEKKQTEEDFKKVKESYNLEKSKNLKLKIEKLYDITLKTDSSSLLNKCVAMLESTNKLISEYTS